MRRRYLDSCLTDNPVRVEWKDVDEFGLWLIRNSWRPGRYVLRIDKSGPFGPGNMRVAGCRQ